MAIEAGKILSPQKAASQTLAAKAGLDGKIDQADTVAAAATEGLLAATAATVAVTVLGGGHMIAEQTGAIAAFDLRAVVASGVFGHAAKEPLADAPAFDGATVTFRTTAVEIA